MLGPSGTSEQNQLSIEIRAQTRLGLADLRPLALTRVAIALKTQSGAVLKDIPIHRVWHGNPDSFSGSGKTLLTVRTWWEHCSRGHPSCKLPDEASIFVPKRLIYVRGNAQSHNVRLVETSEALRVQQQNGHGGRLLYTALSHCWGGDVKKDNYEDLKRGLRGSLLPANFRDAVAITQGIGVSYIWIDSLCIIQDSPRDWEEESPRMGQIYSAAELVIAATASASSKGGCFRQRRNVWEPALMRDPTMPASYYTLGDVAWQLPDLFSEQVESAPLAKRAWAFQERLLSRRMVHFCSNIVLFECGTARASEHDPADMRPYPEDDHSRFRDTIFGWLHAPRPPLSDSEGDRAARGIRGALKFLVSMEGIDAASPDSTPQVFSFSKRWYEIVSAYSGGELTRPTDKLVALSGVADLVQRQHKMPYLAGCWDHGAMAGIHLLWVARSSPLRPRRIQYCAPSWSWASVDGRVELLPRVDVPDYPSIRVVAQGPHGGCVFSGPASKSGREPGG
ncbi:hypothetical protein OQA88_9988 [Cercophora sp. LCS_1]